MKVEMLKVEKSKRSFRSVFDKVVPKSLRQPLFNFSTFQLFFNKTVTFSRISIIVIVTWVKNPNEQPYSLSNHQKNPEQ
jgi:hypothetical protein